MLAELKVINFYTCRFFLTFCSCCLSRFLIFLLFIFISTEKLAEANKRVDALAQQLKQSEAARKKAELVASEAKAEADEAKA